MAIRLSRRTEAEWIDLYAGAALLLDPATAALAALGRMRADELMVELAAAGEVVTKVGGSIHGIPDLSSEDAVAATRQTLTLLSMVEIAARDWRGVLDEGGEDLAFDASLLALLLSDETVTTIIGRKWLMPLHEVVSEKKD
jgi:hypothetical protein